MIRDRLNESGSGVSGGVASTLLGIGLAAATRRASLPIRLAMTAAGGALALRGLARVRVASRAGMPMATSVKSGSLRLQSIRNFRELYVAELQELRSTEAQLGRALERMATAARHPELKRALDEHREQTARQKNQLDAALARRGVDPREHEDQSTQALIREGQKIIAQVADPDVRDAALIASLQRVKHYEIAGYGTLATWAKLQSLDEDKAALGQILDEEEAFDERLSQLAEQVINRDALHG